jgi:hypothetical protein
VFCDDDATGASPPRGLFGMLGGLKRVLLHLFRLSCKSSEILHQPASRCRLAYPRYGLIHLCAILQSPTNCSQEKVEVRRRLMRRTS